MRTAVRLRDVGEGRANLGWILGAVWVIVPSLSLKVGGRKSQWAIAHWLEYASTKKLRLLNVHSIFCGERFLGSVEIPARYNNQISMCRQGSR